MIVAVDVVAKLGDSIIEIARVEPGGAYSTPLLPLPLVRGDSTGFVVHRPDGSKLRLIESDSLIFALGRVTLYVQAVIERSPAVPKKRIEQRPYIYGAAVLVAHLCIWGVAEASFVEPLEKLEAPLLRPRVRVTHVEEEPPPPAPAPAAAQEPTKVAGSTKKGSTKKRGSNRSSGEYAALAAFGDVSMLIPSVDVVKMVNESIAYDEQAAEDAKWGGSSGRFDPFRDCKTNCGTIASGPYETLSFQNRPRPIPRIAIASDDASVKAAVTTARATLVACYVERALDGDTGSVQVELAAGTDGAFALLYSRGLDTVGPCVGAVIDALHLKGTTNAKASITIAFSF